MSWDMGGGRGGRRGGYRHEPLTDANGQKRRGAPFLIPRLAAVAIRNAPFASLLLVIASVGGGLIVATELLIGRELVDALGAALGLGQIDGASTTDLAIAAEDPRGAFQTVLPWIGWLAAAMIGATALELVGHLAEVDLQERVGMRLQREVIQKAHSVDLAHFEHPTFYDALQRANQDMAPRLVQLLRALVEVVGSITGMTAILAVLWQAHWSLAPIMAVGVVPGFWVMLTMRRQAYWVYRVRTPQGRLSNYLQNLLTRRDDAKEVRLFTLAEHLVGRWLTVAKRLAVERRGIEVKQAWLSVAADILGLAAYAGCLVLIATLVAGARVTVGTFSMLMGALQQFGNRIEQVMRSFTTLHEQSLYLADLYEFLEFKVPASEDEAPLEAEAGAVRAQAAESIATQTQSAEPMLYTWDQEADPAQEKVRIELEGVSFTYPSGVRPVLSNINLTIEPGERIALIGENGAGKSTLIRLIMGLYRPTRGRILLGGQDIRTIPEDRLRRYFAAVFQEFVHYQFPVKENIRFGRLDDATIEDVRHAARLSGAAEFVEELPEAYDTMLGRPLGGIDLSGGQWQKLAIARALVRQAPIVVLDEPTAALDPKAEAEVYRQFSEMTEGRTSILISHRLGSARLADRIVVLKNGSLVEMGTHEQLMHQGGEYAEFFGLQAQWYQ